VTFFDYNISLTCNFGGFTLVVASRVFFNHFWNIEDGSKFNHFMNFKAISHEVVVG
jgi:hypothetical protein